MYTLTDSAAGGMSLLDFPVAAGRVVGTAFDEALETNPVPLFMVAKEFNAQKSIGPKLSKVDAEQQATMAGVKVQVPDEGLTQGALAILIERRRDEAARQVVYARSQGAGSAIGQFGASLAGTLLDPANAVAGFIPVLGGTRYTEMLAKATTVGSRAGLRAGIGAAEGLVGATVVEGPTLGLRRGLGDDYGLYDSLANIAFGTLGSSGIRMVGGAARDVWVATRRLRQAQAQGWADMAPDLERSIADDLEAGSSRGPGISEELRAQMEAARRGAAEPVDGQAPRTRAEADLLADAQPIPRGAAQVAAAISDDTHANALRGAVAQAIEGRNIDVDPILRQDPVFGPERMGEADVRQRAIAMQGNDNLVGADRQASLFATEQLEAKGGAAPAAEGAPQEKGKKKKPKKAAAGEGETIPAGDEPKGPPSETQKLIAEQEALLAETRQNADRAAAEAGVQPTPTDPAHVKGEDYEKAYKAIGDCAVKEGR